uniref:DNA-binding response regulator n=1 Tax=Compsopogon caeruleus TaxID=31354 RepID=A0A1Z1XB21_9RHOD|nr:DNA-binding response regulator [Compsopogon caeruleus]ARX96063.1 DNA-binding response regulator [Compsopogon caeruleus]
MNYHSLVNNLCYIDDKSIIKMVELTPKEQNVLNYLIKGLMNKEIAKNTNMGIRNIEYYISRLFIKTKCRSRSDLVRYCIQNKINI